MKFAKIITALIFTTVIATCAPMSASASMRFSDVDYSAHYAGAVEYVTENGLFTGVGDDLFAPDDTLTRAMFVTVLGRTAGIETGWYADMKIYEDVATDRWFAPFAAWANIKGFAVGYGNGYFGADDMITRGQLVLMARKFAAYYDLNVTITPFATADTFATRADAASVAAALHKAFTSATKEVTVEGTIGPVMIGAEVSGIVPYIRLDGGVMP